MTHTQTRIPTIVCYSMQVTRAQVGAPVGILCAGDWCEPFKIVHEFVAL